jgi:hypothetical protein
MNDKCHSGSRQKSTGGYRSAFIFKKPSQFFIANFMPFSFSWGKIRFLSSIAALNESRSNMM